MPEEMDHIAQCEACESPMDVSAVAPFSSVVCPSCGHQSRVKTKFGPYTLTRRHAVGGMSMVFGAQDSTLNREVALKILSEEYSQDETRIRAFEEEARITASFSHPNVVQVLRTGHAFGRFYIAMELVAGGHFEHRIRELGRVPEADLLPMAIEVAQGLKAAKAAGLIHRDVKPGNILLDKDGHAKLVDFGLSLVTQGGKAKATELWATPFYVPPETVEGKEEDFRSDIYALGSTLYHALAGVPPCNEDSMSTGILLKAKTEIIPLKQAAPDISDATCEIVTTMMAYDPEQRFSSYDDLIHALRLSEKQLRQSKRPAQALKPASATFPSQSRKPFWVTIGALVAAIVVIASLLPRLSKGDSDLDKAASKGRSPNPAADTNQGQEGLARDFRKARNALRNEDFEEASQVFAQLHQNPLVQEPTRSWAGIEAILCAYLDGKSDEARERAAEARSHLARIGEASAALGYELPVILGQLGSFPPIRVKGSPESASQTVISAMLGGLKNWQQGLLDPAAECFRLAASAKLTANDQWVSSYQRLASDFLADHSVLTGPLFQTMPDDLDACEKAIEELNKVVESLKTKGRSRYNLRAWQLDLARKAKSLREGQE